MKTYLTPLCSIAVFVSTCRRALAQNETVVQSNLRGLEVSGNRTLSMQRIVGGDVADLGEFPYYVQMSNGCGGSLIAPNIVLTAAHCGKYTKKKKFIVGAYKSKDDTTEGATKVRVAKWKRHPDYDNSSLENDFALVRLAKKVTLDSNIKFSINDSDNLEDGEDLDVLGLGLLEEGVYGVPDKLNDVQVQAVSTDDCNKRKSYNGAVDDATMFCAGVTNGGKDSCQGDSGGPIVRRDGNKHVQVGVVSWGTGCARKNKPGVYSKVSEAYEWIQEVVCNEWSSSATFCDGDNGGGGGDTSCPNGQMEFDFTVTTDNRGKDTKWDLRNSKNKRVLKQKGKLKNNQTYRTTKCIKRDSYTLKLRDKRGNGMSDGGQNPGYELIVDGEVLAEAFNDDSRWKRKTFKFD